MATRIISILDDEGLGNELLGNGGTVPSSGSWGVANKAFYYLFKIREPMVAKKLRIQIGGTPTGNIDCGLFRGDDRTVGASLAIATAVAQGTANLIQEFDITDVPLRGGQLVFVGVSLSSASGQTQYIGTTPLSIARSMGIYQQTTAHPLPSTPTPAVVSTNIIIPLVSIVGHDT